MKKVSVILGVLLSIGMVQQASANGYRGHARVYQQEPAYVYQEPARPVNATNGYQEQARVVSVTPQVEQINQPRQECRTAYVQEAPQQERGIAGTIIGGIAGGILGNQVGGGNGKTVATAVGAVTGAVVGDRIENRDGQASGGTRPVQNCYTVDNWQTRTNGYAVTYEYQGHTYTTVMPYQPGQFIRVNVSVTPVF